MKPLQSQHLWLHLQAFQEKQKRCWIDGGNQSPVAKPLENSWIWDDFSDVWKKHEEAMELTIKPCMDVDDVA